MANTVRDTTTNDKIQFIQSHQTPLNAGKYTITITQNLTVKDNTESFHAQQEFVINGDPFELTPQEIHTVFPPANSIGDHARNLPHIVLTRSTLPWERLAQSDRENAPWLALLVIHDQETQGTSPDTLPLQSLSLESLENPITKQPITVADIQQNAANQQISGTLLDLEADHVLGNYYFRGLNIPRDDFESLTGHQLTDQVTVIDIKRSLLETILPTIEELEYLAHIRQMTDAEDNSLSEPLAVIMSHRLPLRGGKTTVYLVSLENSYNNGTFNYQEAEEQDYIRLITLKHWSFSCIDPENSFMGLLKALNRNLSKYNGQATLRLGKRDNPNLETYLSQGNVPLPHYLRQGGKTFSWYRSPLIPGENTTSLDLSQLSVRSGDQLIYYNANQGMFDVSYAAAWQLGQLLTIKNKKLAVSLFNWKRANAQKLAQNNQQALFPHIFTPNKLNNSNHNLEFPPDIQAWFRELGLLYHIPFNYLVPDEQMLPLESIRFFCLDWFWVECLLDGAFSVGRVQNSDVEQDKKNNPLNRQNQAITGFLLRSEVVSGWPDIQIDGSNSLETGDKFIPLEQRLKLLRSERLSHNVLLCLFAGEIKTVDIYLKPEGLNFGLNEDKNNNLSRQLRDFQGNEQSDWEINPIPYQNQAKNVVKITALIDEIKTKLNNRGITFNHFTSAQFALQMIQGAEKVRFSGS